MFVARWTVEAKFGHKDQVIAICTQWQKDVGDQVGLKVFRHTTPMSRVERGATP